MSTLTDMPLAAIDTETTSVDVLTARLVTASFVTIDGPTIASDELLLNPGIDIPDEAAKVHGITTAKAQAEGLDYENGYRQVRDKLETLFASDRLVCGMNLAYDLSLMHWEGKRLGEPELVVGPVLDPLVIDKHLDLYRKGRRTLTALCEYYGVRQTDAHQSTGDSLAAARLAYRMVRLPQLADYTVDTLMTAQAQWRAEQQESLHTYFLRQGNHEAAATVSGEWPVRRTA